MTTKNKVLSWIRNEKGQQGHINIVKNSGLNSCKKTCVNTTFENENFH